MPKTLVLTILTASAAVAATGAETGNPRPNILWITCEDMSPHLGRYGDAYAVTPNLDGLAEQGVRYTRAFAPASVCTPARSTLITGVFASSLGTQHLRGPVPLPAAVRCFTEYLREAGYYCSNNVKEDYNFATPPGAWDESSNVAHWRKRKAGQPFFSVFNFTTTHQGQIRYSQKEFERIQAQLPPEERHDPAAAPLPPYYPDTPIVRRNVAQLYTQITRMDKQVKQLLDQLDEDGLAEDTIVFFYADHGTGLPRGKRWLHDSGIRVPLIVRFPGKHRRFAPGEPGSTVDRLVSFVDFAPTVLSLADLPIPDAMQGTAFLGPRAGEPRRYVFAIRDRVDEVFEFSRTVRDDRYQYIRNYMPHRPVMQHSTFSEQTPIRQELRRLAAEGKLAGSTAWLMRPTKAAEELYDTQNDPHEIFNLADYPQHQETLQRMRDALRAWMIETRDTGPLPEAEMRVRAKNGSPYDMTRQADVASLTRILDAAELIGRGPTEFDELHGLLADRDPVVRYWAATGLAALGGEARGASAELTGALRDRSPDVRIAAAEALCTLGREKEALPVLADALKHQDPRVRLHAAAVLAVIGEKARGVLPQILAAAADKGQNNHALYTRWALEHVIQGLAQ